MAQVHDPTYDVRRVLWRAYGVLGAGLVLLIVAIFVFSQAHGTVPGRSPGALIPSLSPTATPAPSATTATSPSAAPTPSPSATPGGVATGPGVAPSGSSRHLPSTGPRPGEPRGDVEDDTLINPSALSVPQLPVPFP
jgi:hypothetical protein